MRKKMAQKQQSLNNTITITNTKEEAAAVRDYTERFRSARKTKREPALPGETLARAIANQLPAGGDGVEPPLMPPVPFKEEQTAPKKKKERRLPKQRQEEKTRHLAEERQPQISEEDREKKRQQRRRLLFQDDSVLSLMKAFAQERNPQTAMQKAQNFLRAAGQKLLDSDEELADWNTSSADYVSQVTEPFRLLIATQVKNQDTANTLLGENREHAARFAELGKEQALANLVSLELLNILREECAATDVLEHAAVQMVEQIQDRTDAQMRRWGDFESDVASCIHMASQTNSFKKAFSSGGPFHYLTQPETAAKFKSQTEDLLKKDATLTREAAEKQVFAQHRRELEEASLSRTLADSVVHGVTAEDWKQSGGASFHHILPAAQAYEVVERSDGFLYARPAGAGLCELRPTLPEAIRIDGERIPLRRSYTLFIKALMHRTLNKRGDGLREDAKDFCLGACDHYTGIYDLTPNVLDENLHRDLKPALTEFLGGDEARVEETIGHLKKILNSTKMNTFLPFEIMNNLPIAVGRMNVGAIHDAASRQLAELKATMKKEGRTSSEIKEALRVQKEAISSMYADIDTALREMKAIRDMDPDSPDTPLPNACSAHAAFVQGIRKDCMGRENVNPLRFRTAKHILENPMQHIEYAILHIDQIVPPKEKEKTLKELCDIAQRLAPAEEGGELAALSEKDWETIRNVTVDGDAAPSKYDYHAAADLGQTEEGIRITTEGFAAESKQYVVTPFSRHHAVGLYRGNEREETYVAAKDYVNDGMVKYYSKDNPLPTEKEALLAETKGRLLNDKGGKGR